MAVAESSHADIEEGDRSRAVSGSVCFSESDDQSWHSPFDSTAGGSHDEYTFSCVSDPEIGGLSSNLARNSSSSASKCSVEVDLGSGVAEIKVHLAKVERDCRICHLNLESSNQEAGIPIELGCSCKNDLAAAHKQCAETWFKIRGNKICEIYGATARNVVGANEIEIVEQWNEINDVSAGPVARAETQSFWRGHRFLNFLLACVVLAFVISWLFHFHVPS